MSEEDFAKTPDFKAFGLAITDEMKTEVLDGFADVLDAVKKNEAPPVDLTKWTFNGFKTAIAESLTEAEYEEIKRKVSQVRRSSLPEWKKRGYVEALNYIDEVRGKEAI
jgi:hypothetical protein